MPTSRTARVRIRARIWRLGIPAVLLLSAVAGAVFILPRSCSGGRVPDLACSARAWALASYWNVFTPCAMFTLLLMTRFPAIGLWGLSPRTNISAIVMDRTAMVMFQVGVKVQALVSLAMLIFVVHVETTLLPDDASGLTRASRAFAHIGGGVAAISTVHGVMTRTVLIKLIQALLYCTRRTEVIERDGTRRRRPSSTVDDVTGVSDATVLRVLGAAPARSRAPTVVEMGPLPLGPRAL